MPPLTIDFDKLDGALDNIKDAFILGEDPRLPERVTVLAVAAGFKVGKAATISNSPDREGMRHGISGLMRAVDSLHFQPPEGWALIVNTKFMSALDALCAAMERETP